MLTLLLALYIAGIAGVGFFAGKAWLEDKSNTSAYDVALTTGYILIWPALVLVIAGIWSAFWLYDVSQRWR